MVMNYSCNSFYEPCTRFLDNCRKEENSSMFHFDMQRAKSLFVSAFDPAKELEEFTTPNILENTTKWLAAHDPLTDRLYYYNSVTRETRWYNAEKENNLTFFYNMEDNIRSKFQLSVCDLQSATNSLVDLPKLTHFPSLQQQEPHELALTPPLTPLTTPQFRTLSYECDTSLSKYVKQKSFNPAISSSIFDSLKTRPRSNTTSTIFLEMGTMSSPDEGSLIHCVCKVLQSYMIEALEHRNEISTEFLIFNDQPSISSDLLPTISEIFLFMQEILIKAQMEVECITICLIYIERLLQATISKLQLLPGNWRSILFYSMIMASKFWDDLSMWNIEFSKISNAFTLSRINQLEIAYLEAIQYNVRVTSSCYAKYYFNLRSMWQIAKTNKTTSLRELQILQELSKTYSQNSQLPSRRHRSTTLQGPVEFKECLKAYQLTGI